MRRLTVWALEVVLVLCLGTALAEAQESDQDSPPGRAQGSWLSRLLPFGKTEEKTAPAPPNKNPEAPHPAAAPESAAAIRAREKAILDRRDKVIEKLRDIAYENNDDALLRMADQLHDRAWQLYCKHTAPPARAGDTFQSDRQTLDTYLGVGSNGQELGGASVGGSGESASRTAARRSEP